MTIKWQSTPEVISRRVRIFKALSHPTRLGIVELLADEGPQPVSVFHVRYQIDYAAVSRHLQILKSAGIVEDERRGKNIIYKLKYPCVLNMFECFE